MAEEEKPFRVLVIDDMPAIFGAVEAALDEFCEVRGAENGAAGIDAAHEWHPHLILCDFLMPGLSGMQTVRKLQESDETSSIPIVLLSGVADEVWSFPGVRDQVKAVIAKPFDASQLRAIALNLLKNGEPG